MNFKVCAWLLKPPISAAVASRSGSPSRTRSPTDYPSPRSSTPDPPLQAAAAAPPSPLRSSTPPRDELSGFKRTTGATKEEIVSRVFTFPASKIAALRERYSGGGGFRPSRVEALSAFIWTHFTGTEPDPGKTHALCQNVNLRPRPGRPAALREPFRNMSGISAATPAAGDGGFEVARKVRAAMKAVDGGYVAELKKGEKHLRFIKEMMARAGRGELVRLSFASLCGHPLYGADFGSGPPVWVGHGGFPFENVAIFMDAKSGGGIDEIGVSQ